MFSVISNVIDSLSTRTQPQSTLIHGVEILESILEIL